MLNKLLKFTGVGGVATAIQYILLAVFVEAIQVNEVYSSGLSYSISALFSYYLNYKFTFKSSKGHIEAAIKFFITASIGLLINMAIFYFCFSVLSWSYILGQLLATGIVFFWNFIVNAKWSFKD